MPLNRCIRLIRGRRNVKTDSSKISRHIRRWHSRYLGMDSVPHIDNTTIRSKKRCSTGVRQEWVNVCFAPLTNICIPCRVLCWPVLRHRTKHDVQDATIPSSPRYMAIVNILFCFVAGAVGRYLVAVCGGCAFECSIRF